MIDKKFITLFFSSLAVISCTDPNATIPEPSLPRLDRQSISPVIFDSTIEILDFKNLIIIFQPPPPVYDIEAKRSKIQGTVHVDFIIDETGHVINARATDGAKELARMSESYVMKFQFRPYAPNGKPKSARSTLTCVWKLQ